MYHTNVLQQQQHQPNSKWIAIFELSCKQKNKQAKRYRIIVRINSMNHIICEITLRDQKRESYHGMQMQQIFVDLIQGEPSFFLSKIYLSEILYASVSAGIFHVLVFSKNAPNNYVS